MEKLTGRVVSAGLPGWDEARRGFRACVDYSQLVPKAVVFCQHAADVQNAVRYCRENGLPLRARSGRHSYEAYSAVQGGVVIDVSEMDEIAVDRDSMRARVGAGVFCLDLHEQLFDVGLTVPAASGASVGIAGLALGGGFGVTSRKLGLTCDNVVGIDLVDASGDLVRADERSNSDLLWACRGGGGGNFGIVTAFDMRVSPIDAVAICNVTWRWDDFLAVVDAWQRWAPAADDALSTFLRLGVNGVITLFGQFTPDDPRRLGSFADLLRPVLDAAAPTGVTLQMMPYSAAAATFAGVDPTRPQWILHPHNDRQFFKSTSAVAKAPFPADALALLKSRIEGAPPQTDWETNEPSMIQLLAGGGAPGRVAIDATAVPHRAAQFVVQYDAYWTDPANRQKSEDWIEGVRAAMLPFAGGAYVNYVDSRIEDYLDAYYGPNLARLASVKRAVDPTHVFTFPQGIADAPAAK